MGEFAGFALLAKTTLVVLADQMADAAAFRGRHIVPIGTSWTSWTLRAVGGAEVRANGTRNFGG